MPICWTKYLDNDVLITISKLSVGNRIEVPGEAISNAIKNLWLQGLFDDVAINVKSVQGDSIFFDIAVVERPRLTRIDITGLNKSQIKDIQERVNGNSGQILNKNLLSTTQNTIERSLSDKRYLQDRKRDAKGTSMSVDV